MAFLILNGLQKVNYFSPHKNRCPANRWNFIFSLNGPLNFHIRSILLPKWLHLTSSQQTTNAEPVPIVTSPTLPNPIHNPNIPYPFNPYSGFCPGFGQYPPFYLHCPCDLSSCFTHGTSTQLNAIASANRLRPCDVQQWAAIIEGTMYGIDDYYTLSMVDQVAQSVRHEMTQRDLVYDMDYPAYCNQLYSSLPVSARMKVLDT